MCHLTEFIVLFLFAASLFFCIGTGTSILAALIFGFLLFFGYGLFRHHSAEEMLHMAFSGIRTVKSILITFILIGMITAIWRACGTIPCIVYHATGFCSPSAMVLATFLLCCLISALTGTAFGTAATIGVICITITDSMGIPIFYTGGAVLAGSYFGDRCSPMSTSALLVSTLTATSLFQNLILMIKTALVPFIVTCILYIAIGLQFHAPLDTSGIQNLFADAFILHPAVLIPAVVIILFSLLQINVKITMSISILCGSFIAVFLQNISPDALLQILLCGYLPENASLAAVLSGGGILSMTKVFLIVCISSCYAGMFDGTGLLKGIRQNLMQISHKITPFGGILLTSILTGAVSCNQTLTIMLTHQLCRDTEPNSVQLASHLENTAVVIAPLIPWSIAGTVPLTSVNAPALCILTAFYLYLIPLWNLLLHLLQTYIPAKRKKQTNPS